MALSIGNVNFGVDANTAGLRKAVQQLDAFQRKTNKVAKDQSSAAQATAKAMSRQESAIKGAFQQVLRLQQQFKRLDNVKQTPAQLTQAFQKLTREMTSGKITAVEFTRSMDAFNATMGRARRRLSDLKADEARKRMHGLGEVIRNLESASVLAVGPLSGLGSRIRAIASITNRSTLALAAFFGVVTGGVVILGKLTAAAVRAHTVFEQAQARFLASSGSLALARKQMAFVVETARELGLRIDTSARSFSRLTAATRGTALEGQGTRKIFEGVSKAAAALRLGNLEVEGTFRAIEQIMSKGSVQAEELRGQLGERLPGAFRIAAESMGLTTAELGDMLKTGEVLADEFIPRFVAALKEAFGDRALDNVNSFGGSMNNLANASLLFAKHFDDVTRISKATIGAIQALTATIDFLRIHLITIAKVLGAVGGALLALAAPAIIAGIITVTKAIIAMAKAVVLLNVALLANPIGRIVGWIVKLIAVIGGAIAGWLGMSAAIGDIDQQISDLESDLNDMAKQSLMDMGELTDTFNNMASEIKDARKEAELYDMVLDQIKGNNGPEQVVQMFRELAPLQDLNISKVLQFAGAVSGPLNESFRQLLVDMSGAEGPEQLLTLFTSLQQVMSLNKKELAELASDLSSALGTDVQNNIMGVSLALFEFTTNAEASKEAFKSMVDRAEATTKALHDSREELDEMGLRLKALREGPESVQFFDDVTAKVEKFKEQFEETNVSMEERNRLADLYRRGLIETIALEEQYTREKKAQEEADRAAAKAAKDRIRAQERATEGLREADVVIGQLRKKVAALAQGPKSLQIFEEIEEPLARMKEKLIEAGVPMPMINQQTEEFRQVLMQLLHTQNLVTGAATQTADAIVNGLESMLTLSESVGDSLRNLAKELFKIFLRSMFLDPLRDSLVGAFTDLFSGGDVPTGPLGPPTAVGGMIGPAKAHIVGEKGPELFQPAVSGRIIPNSALKSMGGDTYLTINAPGADAGTISRIKEIVRTELGPQMVKAATQNTIATLRRPNFA